MELKDNERLDDLQIGGLYIIQDPSEYCFTSDAVALANFAKCKSGGRLVDLCSGSGVIGILMNAKNKIKDVYLVELQKHLADMSSRSIEYNHLKNFHVVNAPLQNIYKTIGEGVFDTVVCNPPYKKSGTTTLYNAKESISIARHEIAVTLEDIISESARLLKFGGDMYICNKEERLVDIMFLSRKYGLEPKEMKILSSNSGANVVMLKCRKGGKCGIKILR